MLTPMNASREGGATIEYVILVRGDATDLAETLDARHCEASHGTTLLRVDVIDQAHLHGVIERLRDLNVEIERVTRV